VQRAHAQPRGMAHAQRFALDLLAMALERKHRFIPCDTGRSMTDVRRSDEKTVAAPCFVVCVYHPPRTLPIERSGSGVHEKKQERPHPPTVHASGGVRRPLLLAEPPATRSQATR